MIPLTRKQSPLVITELEKLFYILYMFGFPKKLHSDNGKEFRNKNMENLCQSRKIKFVPVHPENQQSNKALEGDGTMEHESTGADHLEREKGRNSREAPESRKRKQMTQMVTDSQTKYNKKMKVSRNKQTSFRVDDYVETEINKVDKTTPLNPNVILRKIIGMENNNRIGDKVQDLFKIVRTMFWYIITLHLCVSV